jgi:hypothetical protein
MSNSKNSCTSISTLEGLMAQAMDPLNLQIGKSQTSVYLKGLFQHDAFEGVSASKVKALNGGKFIKASYYGWAHIKQIDSETKNVALPEIVGIVFAITSDEPSVPLFLQALYTGMPMKELIVKKTRSSKASGDLEVYGTDTHEDLTVCYHVEQSHTVSGSIVFVAVLPGKIKVEVGSKMFTYDFSNN